MKFEPLPNLTFAMLEKTDAMSRTIKVQSMTRSIPYKMNAVTGRHFPSIHTRNAGGWHRKAMLTALTNLLKA